MGVSLLVPEGDEGEHGVVEVALDAGRGVFAAGGLPLGGHPELVLEFQNNPFGGLFPHPGDPRNGGDIGGHDRGLELTHLHSAEDGQGKLGTDPGDMGHEKAEEIPLLRSREAVQQMGIFPDMVMGQDAHPGTDIGELVVTRERYQNPVADPAGGNDDLVRQNLLQNPFDERDHVPTFYA